MIVDVNEELRQALREFRLKYGVSAAREALKFYLTGLSHAAILSSGFGAEAQHELSQLLTDDPIVGDNAPEN